MTLVRKLAWIYVLALMPITLRAQFATTTNNGAITITGYTGTNGIINVPAAINGYPVTTIGDYAFSGYFSGVNPTKVVIPNSVTNLGSGICYGCLTLTNASIGSGVLSGLEAAFGYCPSLTAVNVNSLNPNYTSVNGILFDKNQYAILQYPAGNGVQNYTIPNSVLSIGNGAFNYCHSLTNVSIPSSVTSIGHGAFYYCSGLYAVAIPDSVTSVGMSAFYCCQNLTHVLIPKRINSISMRMFQICSNLKTILIPTNITSIESSAFEGSGLTSIAIPDSVTNIGVAAFENTALTSVVIPNSITSIASQLFDVCGSLTNVILPNTITNIGNLAFYNCVNLLTITIPNSVVSIGDAAFMNCNRLTAIFFQGDAPDVGADFLKYTPSIIYYLQETTGWTQFLSALGHTGLLWNPQIQNDAGFGVQNNQFGFNITGTTNIPIVVEGSTNLALSSWASIQSCFVTNGSIYFSDPAWTNSESRFYRIRSP